MDITSYANQFIFPLALFLIILFSFYAESYLGKNSIYQDDLVNNNYVSELDNFFEIVSQNENLMSQLELIIEGEKYLEQIVELGNSLGYRFTVSDVEQSIAENTVNSDSNYICLPIGCWQYYN